MIDNMQNELAKNGISVYESEYGWGFTGCESDDYDDEESATKAAYILFCEED